MKLLSDEAKYYYVNSFDAQLRRINGGLSHFRRQILRDIQKEIDSEALLDDSILSQNPESVMKVVQRIIVSMDIGQQQNNDDFSAMLQTYGFDELTQSLQLLRAGSYDFTYLSYADTGLPVLNPDMSLEEAEVKAQKIKEARVKNITSVVTADFIASLLPALEKELDGKPITIDDWVAAVEGTKEYQALLTNSPNVNAQQLLETLRPSLVIQIQTFFNGKKPQNLFTGPQGPRRFSITEENKLPELIVTNLKKNAKYENLLQNISQMKTPFWLLGGLGIVSTGASLYAYGPEIFHFLMQTPVMLQSVGASIVDPITLSEIITYLQQNDQVVARVITGVFLVSDLIHLPVDIVQSFLWRSITHATLFSETTIEQLQAKGYEIHRVSDISVLTLQGKKTVPVFEATTPQQKILRFVPVRRLWNTLDTEEAFALPFNLSVAPLTDAVTSPLTPVGHLMLRAATSKTVAFLIINSLAQMVGNAFGAQINPLVMAPAAITQSAVSNAISFVIQTPIRIGYLVYRVGKFLLGVVGGKMTGNSPAVTQVKEAGIELFNAVRNIFQKNRNNLEENDEIKLPQPEVYRWSQQLVTIESSVTKTHAVIRDMNKGKSRFKNNVLTGLQNHYI